MFEKFNPFKEKVETEQLSEEEKLAKKLVFASESTKDFLKAKEIAANIADDETREATLNKIAEIEEGNIQKTAGDRGMGGSDLEVEDMRDAINFDNLKDAKSIASHLAKNDENYGARAFLEIAQAELRKGIDPEKTISKAREIMRNSEDPYQKVAIFADIMKLEAAQEKLDKAGQTANEIKNMAKNEPGWDEYNARLFATLASAEKNIGQAEREE